MIYTDFDNIRNFSNKDIDFKANDRIYFYTDNELELNKAIQKINEYKLDKIRFVKEARMERDGIRSDRIIFLWEINSIKTNEEKEILISFISHYKNDDVVKLIETMYALKTKIGKNLTLESLEGDMGEAFFIRKCIQLGYKDIIFNASNHATDLEQGRIDFHLKNQKFEVKTTIGSKSEINITNTQILENPNIVVVKFVAVENCKTILDLYNEIEREFGGKLPLHLQVKRIGFNENSDLLSKITYNEDTNIKFFFYDNSFLPNSNWLQTLDEHIKKITFTMDLKIDQEQKFEEKIKNLLND